MLSPVCLPWSETNPSRSLAAGAKTTVMGWGKVTNSKTATSRSYRRYRAAARVLNKLLLRVQSDEECLDNFKDYNSRIQLCSGGEPGEEKDL